MYLLYYETSLYYRMKCSTVLYEGKIIFVYIVENKFSSVGFVYKIRLHIIIVCSRYTYSNIVYNDSLTSRYCENSYTVLAPHTHRLFLKRHVISKVIFLILKALNKMWHQYRDASRHGKAMSLCCPVPTRFLLTTPSLIMGEGGVRRKH